MIVGEARIAAGLRIYAIGDVHGCLREFDQLIRKIDKDLKDNPVKKHQLVCLGDYVDRGPDVKDVIERLMKLDKSDRDTVFLKGNHEDWLLGFLDDPDVMGASYLNWGDLLTLNSYGVENNPGAVNTDLAKAARRLIPTKHRVFLKKLPVYHCVGDFCFVHAGIRPGINLGKQLEHDLIWIRDDFLQHSKPFDRVVVHGHTPTNKPEVHPNRINVDTRCYDTGILTALVIEERDIRFIQTEGWG